MQNEGKRRAFELTCETCKYGNRRAQRGQKWGQTRNCKNAQKVWAKSRNGLTHRAHHSTESETTPQRRGLTRCQRKAVSVPLRCWSVNTHGHVIPHIPRIPSVYTSYIMFYEIHAVYVSHQDVSTVLTRHRWARYAQLYATSVAHKMFGCQHFCAEEHVGRV